MRHNADENVHVVKHSHELLLFMLQRISKQFFASARLARNPKASFLISRISEDSQPRTDGDVFYSIYSSTIGA